MWYKLNRRVVERKTSMKTWARRSKCHHTQVHSLHFNLILLILSSSHRSTCVFWSMRCTTRMSASVTLLPSMMAAVRLSTWRTSSAPQWPMMSCWRPLWVWWGCGQTREAGRADSRSSLQPSMNVSESLSVSVLFAWLRCVSCGIITNKMIVPPNVYFSRITYGCHFGTKHHSTFFERS